MKTTLRNTALLLAAASASAQNNDNTGATDVTIPATNGSLPRAGANGCAEGYYPGTDTVIFTVPYTYPEVISVIGNYTNLTWSGSPENSVTTNNTQALQTNNWTPGSARFYDIVGAHAIETILTYDKPATEGPYIEIHTLAPLEIAAADLKAYSAYDAVNYTSVCNGKAMWANYTVNYCANNPKAATAALHNLHLTDAMTVGKFLGGQNFTSCEALGTRGLAPRGGWGGASGMSNETDTTNTGSGTHASASASASASGMSMSTSTSTSTSTSGMNPYSSSNSTVSMPNGTASPPAPYQTNGALSAFGSSGNFIGMISAVVGLVVFAVVL